LWFVTHRLSEPTCLEHYSAGECRARASENRHVDWLVFWVFFGHLRAVYAH